MKIAIFTLFLALGLPAIAFGTPGLKLRLPSKSPLIVKCADRDDASEPLAIREPLLYLGGTLIWRPLSKTAEVELTGTKATLLLEEPFLWLDKRRILLPAPPHWKDGRLILSRASLELLLKSLSDSSPSFETVTPEELASIAPVGAEPTVVPPMEPEIVKGHESPLSAHPASSGIKMIIIDAGHGGHDPGAHGPGGVEEKDVCLDIAQRLKKQIEKKYGEAIKVKLTRDRDYFVTLRDRTKIANQADADLFISIHNNASPNSKSKGSQVFFYDSRSSDRAAEDLARRENDEANYLEFIMMDMTKSLVRDQSIMLAQSVQKQLGEIGGGVRPRQLSYAPFYVLARTKMPAILVEVAFITNPSEEKLLKNAQYRAQVADGIVDGLETYKQKLARQ